MISFPMEFLLDVIVCRLLHSPAVVFLVGSIGCLEEVDERKVVLSLIEKYHHALIQGQALPLELISRFLNAYPECSLYFQ